MWSLVVITAVQAINQTIDQSNAAETLTSLLQEPAKLTNVLPENALLYQAVLLAEKEDKKLVSSFGRGIILRVVHL